MIEKQLCIQDDSTVDAFITPREYAAAHGVHYHTVLNWIAAKKIPFYTYVANSKTWFMVRASTPLPRLHARPRKQLND